MTKQIRNAAATRRSKLLALACDEGEALLLRGYQFAIRYSRFANVECGYEPEASRRLRSAEDRR